MYFLITGIYCIYVDYHDESWNNGCHFADCKYRYILLNEKFCSLNEMSLKFVPWGLDIIIIIIDNSQADLQSWFHMSWWPLESPTLLEYMQQVRFKHITQI